MSCVAGFNTLHLAWDGRGPKHTCQEGGWGTAKVGGAAAELLALANTPSLAYRLAKGTGPEAAEPVEDGPLLYATKHFSMVCCSTDAQTCGPGQGRLCMSQPLPDWPLLLGPSHESFSRCMSV